ncbi:MAG TPA: dTDP-4-dehydrorhamnose 3,5-epimerase [Ignavibacteria bacterium]|jgi:dTDP-4-dehydrorhamnose 3,5-epimerase
MKFIKTKLEGVLIIEPDVFPDDRGYFFESYSEIKYKQHGFDRYFVQDNISKSKKGTIRGLHYQVGDFAQGKLCQVITGRVLDVAVDIRFGSPTFGEYIQAELSEENHNQLWMPPGFAHGFSVLSEEAVFHYKCTNYYCKKDERSILYNDPDLNIDWQVKEIEVSEKDLRGVRLKDIEKDFIY